jgi:hypothetical protein
VELVLNFLNGGILTKIFFFFPQDCIWGMTATTQFRILVASRVLSKNLKFKIHKIIIVPVVLYGSVTCSLTGREGHMCTKGVSMQDAKENIFNKNVCSSEFVLNCFIYIKYFRQAEIDCIPRR